MNIISGSYTGQTVANANSYGVFLTAGSTISYTGNAITATDFYSVSVLVSGTTLQEGYSSSAIRFTTTQSGTFSQFNTVTISDTGIIKAQGSGIKSGGETYQGSYLRVTNAGLIDASSDGLFINDSNFKIINTGTLSGGNYGIYSGSGTGTIHNSGLITGVSGAMALTSNISIVNDGRIIGDIQVVSHCTITNNGTIDTAYHGVSLYSDNRLYNKGTLTGGVFDTETALRITDDNNFVVNSGTISSEAQHTIRFLNTSGLNQLKNSGQILSPHYAILGSTGEEVITNSGEIVGTVDLGDGNDWFDTRRGVVDGAVMGGLGNDIFYISSRSQAGSLVELDGQGSDTIFSSTSLTLGTYFENLNLLDDRNLNGTGNSRANKLTGNDGNNVLRGGSGNDTLAGGEGADRLDGESGADKASYETSQTAVKIDLTAGTASGGDATGDVLVSIEGLTGSRFNDTLRGNGGNNVLDGNWGNDVLKGMAGNDTLTGGLGKDSFVFETGFGKDTISDFELLNDRIDVSTIAAFTSFADLKTNHMSQSGLNTVIDAGGGNTITLKNIDKDDLLASHFLI